MSFKNEIIFKYFLFHLSFSQTKTTKQKFQIQKVTTKTTTTTTTKMKVLSTTSCSQLSTVNFIDKILEQIDQTLKMDDVDRQEPNVLPNVYFVASSRDHNLVLMKTQNALDQINRKKASRKLDDLLSSLPIGIKAPKAFGDSAVMRLAHHIPYIRVVHPSFRNRAYLPTKAYPREFKCMPIRSMLVKKRDFDYQKAQSLHCLFDSSKEQSLSKKVKLSDPYILDGQPNKENSLVKLNSPAKCDQRKSRKYGIQAKVKHAFSSSYQAVKKKKSCLATRSSLSPINEEQNFFRDFFQ